MKLNLHIPINSLGYGVVGYNIWKNIRDKVDTTVWPIANNIELPVEADKEIADKLQTDINKQADFDSQLTCLKIWHENQLAERIGRGPLIAFPFFEVSEFDARRKSHLLSADRIVVASKWAKEIVEKNIYRDAAVVPCGVDRSIFNDICSTANPNKCIFFTCGKWEYRKGHDKIYDVFARAFQGHSDVELWMMCDNPFLSNSETQFWTSKFKFDSRIKLINRVKTQNDLARIMANTFCGIFLSRAEGWNLEALEMMSMGKFVVITNYSAHTEFCTNDNSFLLDIKNEEPAYDGKWFRKNCGVWADLDQNVIDSAVECLRRAYELWKENPASVNGAGIKTAKLFGWDNSIDLLLEVL